MNVLWHIQYNGHQVGPMTIEQMRAYGVDGNTLVWCEGMTEWKQAYNFPEIMSIAQVSTPYSPSPYGPPQNSAVQQPQYTQPQPQPQYNQQPVGQVGTKNKTTAGLLAFFLGVYGAQYFYLGKTTPAIIMLALGLLGLPLTVLTFGIFGFYYFVVGIICLIQSIKMWTMSDQEFYEKYENPNIQFPIL